MSSSQHRIRDLLFLYDERRSHLCWMLTLRIHVRRVFDSKIMVKGRPVIPLVENPFTLKHKSLKRSAILIITQIFCLKLYRISTISLINAPRNPIKDQFLSKPLKHQSITNNRDLNVHRQQTKFLSRSGSASSTCQLVSRIDSFFQKI